MTNDDVERLAEAYAEFAAEDRELAEAGLEDYAAGLREEDAEESIGRVSPS